MKALNSTATYLLLGIYLLLSAFSAQAQEDELLRVDQAFTLVAHLEGNNLVAEYSIAPGYYLYRERIKFQIESNGATLGQAVMPDGVIKNDEFFGDMEIYRGNLTIIYPVVVTDAATRNLDIKATSQGCADIGVCYPPHDQSLNLSLGSSKRVVATAYSPKPLNNDGSNASKTATLQALLGEVISPPAQQNKESLNPSQTSNSPAQSLLQSFGASFGQTEESDIPHPDQAFVLSASLDSKGHIKTRIKLYPNTYLYRDKTKIEMADGGGHLLGAISLPSGDEKNDEFFGQTEVYHDELNITIPVISSSNATAQYTLAYHYQGCVEDRVCYPPITKYLTIDTATGSIDINDQIPEIPAIAIARSGSKPAANATQVAPVVNTNNGLSEQGEFAQILKQGSIILIVGLFFLAGLGLTFTPCVFPMIPILSSIIAGQGASITTRGAFKLSLVYVLAMAATYAVAGAIVGYYGAEFNIQIWFQDPIILSIFAAIFVLLALSMFGFYDIQMPAAIQSRITAISNSQQGGTLVGVGLMGFFSAIIVGPCITAPLVGALIFISQTQDWQLGGIALFALGLGMGTPLILIGTSAGKILPRAGAWMDIVKSIFGVVMLGVAIWLLERILPVEITMVLIAILMITSAIYMGALEAIPPSSSGWRRLYKGFGIIFLISGAAYLLGAAAGSKDLIQPLKGVMLNSSNTAASRTDHIVFRQIKGQQGVKQALADSVRQNRRTMLDFYADWCISCKEMEKYAFTHPGVLSALEQVTTLQADVTANDAIDSALMNALGIYGPPAILFFDEQGREIRDRRVVGEMSGDEFAAHIAATFD